VSDKQPPTRSDDRPTEARKPAAVDDSSAQATRLARPTKPLAASAKPSQAQAPALAKSAKPSNAPESKASETPASAVEDDKTRLIRPSKIIAPKATAPAQSSTIEPVAPKPTLQPSPQNNHQATQYTRYNSTHANSTGFDKAQQIAQQTIDNSGMLLKKRFVLEEVLGHGGMGTVYKAKDLRKVEAEDPNPYIATKVLNQDFKDHPNAFVTLQQEAAKSHTLAHPNIVTVHDFDRDGDTLFMTMELLEGKPLDDLLRADNNQGLEKPQALKIIRDLCAALAYAHQRQIIHADFKPGNVFVMTDGSAKVLDFGIARAASKESQKHKFDAGQLGALTPAYATIEMINDEPLTFTDDVYALACVAYEVLSGKHPYASRSAFTAKEQGLKPKRIESLNGREWRALQRGLSLDKAQRTATVKEFMYDLFPRRSARMLQIAVTCTLVAVAGAGWFAYQQYQAKIQIQTTIAEKLQQAQSCFVRNDFACSIEQSSVVVNLDPENGVAKALLENAQLARQSQQNNERINSLLQDGEACLQQQDYACTTRTLERALVLDPEHPQTLLLQSRLLGAQQQSEQAAQSLAQQINEYINQGQMCFSVKDYDCAIQQADAALVLNSNYGPAITLKQSAALAQEQTREASIKVNTILAEAKTCLEKQKNYSCAIAKAEAALNIIPDHREATEIKQRAQQTQQQLKETGFNIR
jgi:tetratricopeptide (TPR) repeat protein